MGSLLLAGDHGQLGCFRWGRVDATAWLGSLQDNRLQRPAHELEHAVLPQCGAPDCQRGRPTAFTDLIPISVGPATEAGSSPRGKYWKDGENGARREEEL